MDESSSGADLAAPEGYIFVADTNARLAHLGPADQEVALPVCGAPGSDYEAFTYLPHQFTPCANCARIAGEASSRPV